MPKRTRISTNVNNGRWRLGLASVLLATAACAPKHEARDFEQAEVELTVAGLQRCGLRSNQFQVEYVSDFQSAAATISGASAKNRTLFNCLSDIKVAPIIMFDDEIVEAAYSAFQNEKYASLYPTAKGDGSWERMTLEERRHFAVRTTKECGLPEDRLMVFESGLRLQPQVTDNYKSVDCVLEKLKEMGPAGKMGFVGNEFYTRERR